MSTTKKILLCIFVVIVVALLIVAFVTGGAQRSILCPDCAGIGCDTCEGMHKVTSSLWAFLPPIVAIGLALITKEAYSSLFAGILVGGILNSGFSFSGTLDNVVGSGLISAVADSAGIFIFLVELGIIVALINKAGGSAAFGRWAKKHIKSRIGAMLATFALGVLIFVDDYFNCLTVGSVMRPVTDSKKVSRAKLSYLIDATAAPICMIAPISSWAAAVSGYVPDGQGISFFIQAIPYNFYSLLTIVFIFAITFMNFDYGPMKRHEFNAIYNDDLYTSGDKNEVADIAPNEKGRVIDIIIPIITLIVSCVVGLIYVGGFFDHFNFVNAFADTDATVGLPLGGLVALVLIVVYLILRRVISFKDSMICVPNGFIAMVPAILILTFATALKNITSLMGAKYFVAEIITGQAAIFEYILPLIPAIVFIIACFISFSTGTSWGTFGILIPIVLNIFDFDNPLFIISISACLAGAVCGDHCSPISDTTIMSSAGGQCNHLNHVSTQIPYAITVAAISFVMFLIAGFVQNIFICLPIGIALTVGTLLIIKLITRGGKKPNKA